MAYVSTVRSDGLDSGTWDPSSLARYGYVSSIPGGSALLANLGVIGESAIITRTVMPSLMPYVSPLVLVTDLFSFVPGINQTFDLRSIDVWTVFGAPIQTSRPGGMYTTFYMVGGNIAVFILSTIFSATLRGAMVRVQNGSVIVFPFFTLFLSCFILGVYGVGWPTGMLFLSIIVFVLVFFFASIRLKKV